MMDLLERYLDAMRRNLPAADADDIVAELRDVLLARAEEGEERLGHPFGKADWETLLVEFGHPLTIAARYRQHQWLIGPELYPFYLHFLKLVGGIVAAVVIVTAVVRGIIVQGPPGAVIAEVLGSLWWSLASTVGSVTIVFVLIERYGGAARHFRTWHPRQLPDIVEKQPGRWEPVFEVALGVVFLLWWTGVVALPVYSGGAAFRLEPAPIWNTLFWPILILAAARLLQNLVHWLRPQWKWLRGLLGIATTAGGIMLAAAIYRAGHWAVVVPTGMSAAEAAKLQSSLDLALGIAVPVVAIVWLLQCLAELWRFVRVGRRG